MTWNTMNPLGPSDPVLGTLILVTLLALGYALSLLYRVIWLREGRPIPPEGLDEDREEDEDDE